MKGRDRSKYTAAPKKGGEDKRGTRPPNKGFKGGFITAAVMVVDMGI